MAEQRSFIDRILNRGVTYQDERKRYNFFRDDDFLYNANSFIQGWNTDAGKFDVKSIGNGSSNSVVVACLNLLGISFSEAHLTVYDMQQDETYKINNHPFALLMRRPNPFMSGDLIQQYIINAMHVSGDAYLLKQRNEAGELIALYPLMPERVAPKGNDDELITHYEYEIKNKTVLIQQQDIVHLRMGLNPTDHKRGFSPLRSVLREIYGDESAGQMATALLANSGVPSVMITPKDSVGPTPDEAEQIAKTYQQKVSGSKKGMPLVMSGSMDVKKMAFSPTELDIGTLRHVPEQRISAVLGVPAILAGLGAGLENATYSNAKELREFFTEQKLIPLWKMVGEEMTQQVLLRDYESEKGMYAEYDFSSVRALQQDLDATYNRMNVGVQGGWITVAEAREYAGLPYDEKLNYYYMPNNAHVMFADEIQESHSNEMNYEAPDTEDDEEQKNIEGKIIMKQDDNYCVFSESGKKLGCYPTREQAEERLRQIERFS